MSGDVSTIILSFIFISLHERDIQDIERVQRRATKLVPELKYLPYIEILRQIGLTTMEARRQRGDLIQYFKFANNINQISWYYPNSLTNSLYATGPASSTRGHKQRLRGQLTKDCPARTNYFTNRIVNSWNDLPSEVISAQSVNAFKNRYDRHLKNIEKTMSVEPVLTINQANN